MSFRLKRFKNVRCYFYNNYDRNDESIAMGLETIIFFFLIPSVRLCTYLILSAFILSHEPTI